MRCSIACLAVCAAIRPKFCGVTSISMLSPSWTFGERRRASASEISSCLLTTFSTTNCLARARMAPVLRSISMRRSSRGTDTSLGSLQQSLLDGLEQDFLVDALFALQIFQHHYQFAVHKRFVSCGGTTHPGNKKVGSSTHSFRVAKIYAKLYENAPKSVKPISDRTQGACFVAREVVTMRGE